MGGSGQLEQADAEQVNKILLEKYLEVLRFEDIVEIAHAETSGKLSGLFLPCVSEEYLRSPFRVMLVGQETRGWAGSISDFTKFEASTFSMRDYIEKNMERYRKHGQKSAGTSKFKQFHSELHNHLSKDVASTGNAIFWGNTLCASLNEASPVSATTFERLREISEKLLSVQFEVLRPNIVVFASGYRYDKYIKPVIGPWVTLDGFESKRFWPFETSNFFGYRVPHPRRHDKILRKKLIQTVRLKLDELSAIKHGQGHFS